MSRGSSEVKSIISFLGGFFEWLQDGWLLSSGMTIISFEDELLIKFLFLLDDDSSN